MQDTPITSEQAEVARLFEAALVEVVAAIGHELDRGKVPSGRNNEPTIRIGDNGMPAMSNGSSWEHSGPPQYADLLDQAANPEQPHHKVKYSKGRFPSVDALADFIVAHPECTPAYDCDPKLREGSFGYLRMVVEFQLTHAANRFFQRHGHRPFDARLRQGLLRPFWRGLFSERVDIAHIVPIAMVKFDFDRVRLASDVMIIRMSDALQKARWRVKAYGAAGHDSVVSAATHAFVLKGWHWPNADWIAMSQNLAAPDPVLREQFELLFAALRLATGVETGFAQEVRLYRRWTHFDVDNGPEVNAAGARRYPEHFDNFGWVRTDLPLLSRRMMPSVAEHLAAIRRTQHDRLELALRRLNSAMIRSDLADAILDATIALEILLSDGDGQAIGYKLRMRAAALVRLSPLAASGTAAKVSEAIKEIYAARSRIVHGGRRGKGTKDEQRAADETARTDAIGALRTIIGLLLEHPRFLDPAVIDKELLLGEP
jgi:hypothetical protein